MSARVAIEDDWMRDRTVVRLADVGEHQIDVYDFAAVSVHRVDRHEAAPDPVAPLSLTHDMARALYEALAAHFGGHSETATLRKDYEAERARVDLFIAKAVRS